MQTRRQAVIEVTTNTVVGMVGSWVISYTAVAMVEDKVFAVTIATIGCTIWSLVRGYYIRRRFAKLYTN